MTGWLAGPASGPSWEPSQPKAVFHQNRKIIEEKCICQGAGIHRAGPALTQDPRLAQGVGTQGDLPGTEPSGSGRPLPTQARDGCV